MKFKVGDKVYPQGTNRRDGEKGVITKKFVNAPNAWWVRFENEKVATQCYYEYSLILISSNIMNKLTSKLKRLFNPSLQKQYKAGLIDNCGNLTSAGQEELNELLRDFFDKQLVEKAEEIIKEETK